MVTKGGKHEKVRFYQCLETAVCNRAGIQGQREEQARQGPHTLAVLEREAATAPQAGEGGPQEVPAQVQPEMAGKTRSFNSQSFMVI